MPLPRLPQNDREITYQAGWKKVTIHKKAETETAPARSEEKGFMAYIWHKAPMLPAALDGFILFALPVISLLAIAVLIYFLNQFQS